jgi:hypothetical protein
MSSTDPYPEVTVDESGIVPNQGARGSEWPKKIRTLTAAELDRLTIDRDGRFYWDGKLVNYEPPESERQPAKSDGVADPSSLDGLERSPYAHIEQDTPARIEGADLARPLVAREREDLRAVDYDTVREPAVAEPRAPSAEELATAAAAVRVPEHVHVKLSRWQSLGAIIVVLGMLVGASGIAAYGLVAAHDWGCRIGLVTTYCPQSPADKPPARLDIPA